MGDESASLSFVVQMLLATVTAQRGLMIGGPV